MRDRRLDYPEEKASLGKPAAPRGGAVSSGQVCLASNCREGSQSGVRMGGLPAGIPESIPPAAAWRPEDGEAETGHQLRVTERR